MAATEATPSSEGWTQFQSYLPRGWRELAYEMGVVRDDWPAHMNVKFTSPEPLLRTVFYYVAEGCSMEQTVVTMAAKGVVDITKAALHFRLGTLGAYMAALLERLTQELGTPEKLRRLCHGYEVKVLDGTSVQRPGAKGTTARVHYALDLATLRLEDVRVTDASGGETLVQFTVKSGQLWLLDRGYSNAANLRHALNHGADILARYNRGALPLFTGKGKPFALREKLSSLTQAMQKKQFTSLYAEDYEGRRMPVRLCAMRLDDGSAEHARKRLRRELGEELTDDQAFFCHFVLVVTTVPEDRMSLEEVLELYRMRWQVELYIKRDKSLGELDELPCSKPETIETWLYTKLVLTQLVQKMAAETAAFFPLSQELPAVA
jgi:hypothetical protein